MSEPKTGRIALQVSEDDQDVAYLRLPAHPGAVQPGCVSRTVRLRDLIADYGGPDLFLDFDAANTLIGVEILA